MVFNNNQSPYLLLGSTKVAEVSNGWDEWNVVLHHHVLLSFNQSAWLLQALPSCDIHLQPTTVVDGVTGFTITCC